MKRSPPASATWTWPVVALLLLASALAGYPQAQKKSATSTQEKPDALLAASMEKMSIGVWSVNGTVTVKKTIKLRGLLSGEDFDLTMEPGVNPNTPMREIVIKDKAWICSDGETLLHVRLKVPEKKINPKELPQYWIVLDSQGQAQYIGHTEMPMFSQAKKEVLYCSFDYAPAKENIAPPPLGPPVDDKAYGFYDIEQHKFDWKGKIVRLQVTPKLLESKQIGESTYRAFLKDTATPNHYGIVEFPYDALVQLGFLKKIVNGTHGWEELEKMGALGRTEGQPVSFYVEVIPIGEKPAARAMAVGAKFNRDTDGTVSYSWGSSSPAAS